MVKLTETINRAIEVAATAHGQQGQVRKGSETPYIVHPFGVMMLASEVTEDEDTLVACLLHDVLEDVDPEIYSCQQMYDDFGLNVVRIVQSVTKNESVEGWRERNKAYIDKLADTQEEGALIVCSADKLYNLGATVKDFKEFGPQVWQRFTTKSVEDQLWYYGNVHSMLESRMPDSPLVKRIGGLLITLRDDLSVV